MHLWFKQFAGFLAFSQAWLLVVFVFQSMDIWWG
jgi:hypothetical protein